MIMLQFIDCKSAPHLQAWGASACGENELTAETSVV